MVKIDEEENSTIHITRGDTTTGKINRLAFYHEIKNLETGEIELYKFQPEDKITFVVMAKKGYTKTALLRKEYTLKDIGYTEETTTPEIPLTSEDTKKFPLKNKKATYWYDLVINDSMTISGYNDETGATKIIVYPESGEIGE